MHKILPAIAFCLAFPAAFADTLSTGSDTPARVAREGLVHATLVVPATAAGKRGIERGVAQASLQHGVEERATDDGPPANGMLLAALALMVGIVLRRWGGGHS